MPTSSCSSGSGMVVAGRLEKHCCNARQPSWDKGTCDSDDQQQQSADAASAADQQEEHALASDNDDACSVVSQFDDDSHQWITNFNTKQAPVFELHIDEQLRAQLPRNDAEYSTSFIHDLMLGRGIRPPAELHQNRGKRVKYLLSTRSVALPKAAEDSQQLRTSNILARLHGTPQLPQDIAALSQVAAHAKALVQVSSAAAIAIKAEAALATKLGCAAAAAAAQDRAVEAVAAADRACKDAVAAAGELHTHAAFLKVLREEHELRLAWQAYTCQQAAAAGGELADKEDACDMAVEREKHHRMSIIKSVQAAIDTAIKSAAITEQEDKEQQRAEEKAMHKQALQDSSITAEFYLEGTLHLIEVGKGQQQGQGQQGHSPWQGHKASKHACRKPVPWSAPAVVDPGTTVDELDEWRQLQQTESPLARLNMLEQMIRSGVMPFGLPEATKRDITAAVLRGLPWLRRTKQQLLCWEQQRFVKRLQVKLSRVHAQSSWQQPTRNAALRELLTHAVRHVLAAPERYCELKQKALRLRLTAGSSSAHVHRNLSPQWLEQRCSLGVRAHSLLQGALMRAVHAAEPGAEEQKLRQGLRDSRSERRYQYEISAYSRTAYPGLQEVLQEELQQGKAAAEQRRAWLKLSRPAVAKSATAAGRPSSAGAAAAAAGCGVVAVAADSSSSFSREQLGAPGSSAMHAAARIPVSPVPVLGGPGSSFSKPKAAFKQSKTVGRVECAYDDDEQGAAIRKLVQVQLP